MTLQAGWQTKLIKPATGTEFDLPLGGTPDLRRNGDYRYDAVDLVLANESRLEQEIQAWDRVKVYDQGILVFHGYVIQIEDDEGSLQLQCFAAPFIFKKRFTRRWGLRGVSDYQILKTLLEMSYESQVQFLDLLDFVVADQVVFTDGVLELAKDTAFTYYPDGALQTKTVAVSGPIKAATIKAEATGTRTRTRSDPYGAGRGESIGSTTLLHDTVNGVLRPGDEQATREETFLSDSQLESMVNVLRENGEIRLALGEFAEDFEDGAPESLAATENSGAATLDTAFTLADVHEMVGLRTGPDKALVFVYVTAQFPLRLYELTFSTKTFTKVAETTDATFWSGTPANIAMSTAIHDGEIVVMARAYWTSGSMANSHITKWVTLSYNESTGAYAGSASFATATLTYDVGTGAPLGWDAVLGDGVASFNGSRDSMSPEHITGQGWCVRRCGAGTTTRETWGPTFSTPSWATFTPPYEWHPGQVLYTAGQTVMPLLLWNRSSGTDRQALIHHSNTKNSLYTGTAWRVDTYTLPVNNLLLWDDLVHADDNGWCFGRSGNDARLYVRDEPRVVITPTSLGAKSIQCMGGAFYHYLGVPVLLQGTVSFMIYRRPGKEVSWSVGNEAFQFRITTTGDCQWKNTSGSWTTLSTTMPDSQWLQVVMVVNLNGTSSQWTCQVKLRGVNNGFVGRASTPTTPKLAPVVLGTHGATEDFLYDALTIESTIAGTPITQGSLVVRFPAEPHDIHALTGTLTPQVPSGAAVTLEASLDNGATWTDITGGGEAGTLNPTYDRAVYRITLTTDLTGQNRPTVQAIDATIKRGYGTGTYTMTTVDLEPSDVRGDYITITEDTVLNLPGAATAAWRVSSNGGTNWTTYPTLGEEVQIPPAEVGSHVLVELTLTSPDAEAPAWLDQLVVSYRETGDDTTVTFKVSRDGGTTFHIVAPGERLDLESFTGESPRNRFILRIELATTNNAVTPQVEDVSYTLETEGQPYAKVLDVIDAATAAYPLREAAGSVAAENVGSATGYDLTVPAAATLLEGFGGVDLPGTAGQELHASPTLPTAYPVSLHCELEADATDGDRGAWSLVQEGDAVRGIGIGIRSGEVLLYVHDGTTEGSLTAALPSKRSRIHVEAILESATSRKLFVNGRLAASATASVPLPADLDRVQVGALHGDGTGLWDGRVYHPVLREHAPSDEEGRIYTRGTGAWPVVTGLDRDYDTQEKSRAVDELLLLTGADAWWRLDQDGVYHLEYGVERSTEKVELDVDQATLAKGTDGLADATHYVVSGGPE